MKKRARYILPALLLLATGCREPRVEPPPAPVSSLPPLTSNFTAPVNCWEDDSLNTLLAAEGQDRCHAGVPVATRAYTYPHNPLFQVAEASKIAEQPLNYANRYAAETSAWLDAAVVSGNPVSRAIQAAAFRQGYVIQGAARTALDLNAELAALVTASGGHPDSGAIAAATINLPCTLRERLAPIIKACTEAYQAREGAFSTLSSAQRTLIFDSYPNWADNVGAANIYNEFFPWHAWSTANNWPYRDAATKVDYGRLYNAALNLAITIEYARLSEFAGTKLPANVDYLTPLGWFSVYDAADNVYVADEPFLFHLDLGGNDTHVGGGANYSLSNPVSVVIDLAGNDVYKYPEVPIPADSANPNRLPSDRYGRASSGRTLSEIARQGAGRSGIGMLFDLGAGSDTYRSLRCSQGFGLFGVGALYDEGGADHYKAEAAAQGASHFGMGLLIDRSGNDDYLIYHAGQGYGGSKGFGALLDGEGDDIYNAVISQPGHGGEDLYPGPDGMTQTYAQGTGWGARRYDASSVPYPITETEGFLVYAGGVGVLRDRTGRDEYTSAGFSMGSGYYFGVGIFDDGGGDDHYYSHGRYSQGGAPHAGIGLFFDRSGNDSHNQNRHGVYFATGYVSMGFGYDFGTGFFFDAAGNDIYTSPAFSYGATQYSGSGFFLDAAGNDTYNTNAGAYFMAAAPGDLQWDWQAVAYFCDASGTDTYNTNGYPPGCGNSKVWPGIGTSEGPAIFAHGGDVAAGKIVFP